MERSQKIIRASVVGIVVNLVLVAFKLAVGLAAHSIAVILDAVNNLSDALSSIITIVGTRLAGRRPDKKHPYGYGRVEYLTGMAIAVIVLLAGVTSLKESVGKILAPEAADYSFLSLAIIAVAILAKLLTGRYVKGVGESLRSQALAASGSDALFDAVLSLGTLVGAVLSMAFHWNLEGVIGAAISLFILKAGVEMLLETFESIVGTRADPELSSALRELVCAFPEVRGAYDLTLHVYGPSHTIGSIHVEVDDDMPAREIHRLTRAIATEAYLKLGVVLTVGVYAANDSDKDSAALRAQVEEIVAAYPEILQLHGFYVDAERKRVTFDLVIDFAADAQAIYAQVYAAVAPLRPGWRFDIVLDSDYSD